MKQLLLILLLLCNFGGLTQCPSVLYKPSANQNLPPQTYCPVNSTGWHLDPTNTDEFTGATLDPVRWNTLPQGVCNGTSDQAYVKRGNSVLQDGKLKITCKKDTDYPCGNNILKYSSGFVGMYPMIHYGYFEIKSNTPVNPHLQPCFWSFSDAHGDLRYDEIDVNECIVEEPEPHKRIRHNIYHHQDSDQSGQLIEANFNQSLSTQIVTYAVEWFPYEIIYYTNGEVTGVARYSTDLSLQSPNNTTPISEFSCIDFENAKPQWIMLSLALKDTNSGTGVLGTYEVEYIHSFKLLPGFHGLYWPVNISFQDPNLSRVHRDIQIGGDANHSGLFPSNCQINLWANNSITFEKGFEIGTLTKFTARTVITDLDCFMPGGQKKSRTINKNGGNYEN